MAGHSDVPDASGLSQAYSRNLLKLAGPSAAETVADPDTLAYYAERAPVGALEKLLASMTRRLIRSKALDRGRLLGYFLVAIDGSQACTFATQPWPGVPNRKLSENNTQFFAYLLDAKLIMPCGMALSLATEMLSNDPNASFDTQDSELKAFPRLIEKLHTLFPTTPFCLLLDALYAKQNIIRLIEAKGWKYIITFKKGSMPERFAEAETLAAMQPNNQLDLKHNGKNQRFRWTNNLPIAEFNPGVLFCHEHSENAEPMASAWLTNFHLCPSNVEKIANNGGRLRWKIENEGFNVQKNNGYEMTHPCGRHPNGFRIFYILLLIAHYINQLILHGSLIAPLCKTFGSAKNFARPLAESMRNHLLPDNLAQPGQIRFRPP